MNAIKEFYARQIPSRNSELTVIRTLRPLSLLIGYICVAVFFGFQLYELHQDERTLVFRDDYNPSIPTPIVYFCADFNFTVDCMVTYSNNVSSCNEYVEQIGDDIHVVPYTIVNTSNLNFADDYNYIVDENTIYVFSLTVNIVDTTFISGEDAGMIVWFTDKETKLGMLMELSDDERLKGSSDYAATISADNYFRLANNQSYAFFYERKIANRLNQDAVNILSGDGQHTRLAMIDGFLVSYPGNGNYSYIEINPKSFVTRTETEISNLTIMDAISNVGGIYAAALVIYRFLYGTDGIRPWGLVQNLPHIRRKARSALHNSLSPNIPFTGSVLSKDLLIDEKVAAIEQKQLALELFLKEYVVNVDNIIHDQAN
ncbi:7363_t:CDS:2 [Paraglomus brasilianum]|uniref:7363_t:CDS:1 n=1 Tax=Paraglomus brasilianum TaxID=144538 RepID=A0A9N8ZVQ0_9GLOM|nr:7363_t:CDS:2 [Paraglomus brasilianum]